MKRSNLRFYVFLIIFFTASFGRLFSQNNIEFVSKINGDVCTDIAVQGNNLFLLAGNQLQIYDIAEPSLPELAGNDNFNFGYPKWHPKLVLQEKIAYVVNNEKLYIVDVSMPSTPRQLGEYDFGGSVIAVNGKYAYIAGGIDLTKSIKILDINDPQDVQSVASLGSTKTYYCVNVLDDYLYLAEHDGFHILDVSSPSDPKELVYLTHHEGYDHVFTFAINDNYTYVFTTADISLKTLDVNSKTEPVLLSNFMIDDDFTDWGAIWDCSLQYPYIYITGNSYDVMVLDISDPTNPVEKGTFRMDSYGVAIAARDDLIFVNSGNNGIYILRNRQITSTGNDERKEIPQHFGLSQNYPNPFNPFTSIQYFLPEAGPIMLVIYDLRGAVVRILINTYQNSGPSTAIWDATNDQGRLVPAGIYLYSLEQGAGKIQKKMVLLR